MYKGKFHICLQLLGNMLQWHDISAEKPLAELALDGLLNRYIILALQNSTVDKQAIYACQVVSGGFLYQQN